jgi:LDH2 family malate/lactate/ureidoglycolate dehydrogenase
VDRHTQPPAGGRLVSADALEHIARSILEAAGTPAATAGVVATSLVESNLVGHDSHGVRRLTPYLDAIDARDVRPAARAETVESAGATSVVTGHRGFGQPAAHLAVEVAADLASRYRTGMVAIRECNHVGRLGEYVEALSRQGLIGLAFGNADPTVAPFGGRERRLGTNPLAWAVPRGADHPPLIMDWATASVAEGKLAVALARGESVPEGTIVDGHGRPSTDPAAFYGGGALLPFGGHKGYGLSVMIEILGGLLTGTGISCLPGYDGRFGTVLLAVDIEAFVELERFRAETEEFCGALSRTAPADGFAAVLVPGEIEARTRRERMRDGVPVPAAHWQELAALARRAGVHGAFPPGPPGERPATGSTGDPPPGIGADGNDGRD